MISGENLVRPATILALHKLGFKVVPLGPDGKTPAMGWSPIYETGWNPNELSEKFALFNNIATCFGQSHLKDKDERRLYLNCLDVDSHDAFRMLVSLQDPDTKQNYSLIQKCIEQTYVSKTRKRYGYHIFWFSHDPNESIKSESCKAGFEFEIKTNKESGLATLPPSSHRDDPEFHYDSIGKNVIMISDGFYSSITNLLKGCLRSEKQQKKKFMKQITNEEQEIELTDAEADDIANAIKNVYRHGHRHVICLHLAGYFYRHNISLDSSKEVFTRITRDDEEKQSRFGTLEVTYKKEKHEVTGYRSLYETLQHGTNADDAKKILGLIYSKILAHKDIEAPADVAFHLAETIRKEWIFRTMNDTREVYYYQEGRYNNRPSGERIIEIECGRLIPNIKTAVVNETIEIIRRTTPVNRWDFDSDPNIVNTKNCLVTLRTGGTRPHTPDFLSLIQLPVIYDRKAVCPAVIHFLYNILSPSDVPLVLEYLGNCLTRNTRLQRAFLAVGEEDNGKSVLLHLMRALLGIDNTSSKTLHQLTSNRFATSDLYGKLANIFADISAKRLEDVETFKVLATGDRISAEKKGKDSFDFDPSLQMIFSANTPPKPNDDMDGSYYRRWMLVPVMLRTHDYFSGKRIVKEKHILDKISTPAELSGLLNLVLISARRVLTKHQFSKNPTVEEVRNLYQRLADPVKAWLDERCVLGPSYESDKPELHADYIQYCWDRRLNRLELNALGRELSKFGVQDVQRGSGKSRVHLWGGITLRKNLKDDDQTTL
jgi:putative DNA primase/helicase